MVRSSVVVVAYNMERELPRTLATLATQAGVEQPEIIVVDNGSTVPIPPSLITSTPGARLIRIDDAPASPARACNTGIAAAENDLVGVIVDGARMASPGLLRWAQLAAESATRAVVTAPAYHLGPALQMSAEAHGYDTAVEDELLESIEWASDGYQLFSVSVLAASSGRGWFGPMGESSSLFLRRELWEEHGGYDEQFGRPGGGLVNHDVYRRACELREIDHVVLFGEGTFHQIHGGAATSGPSRHDELWAEYESIRGRPFVPPNPSTTYLGEIAPAAYPHLIRSAEWLQQNR